MIIGYIRVSTTGQNLDRQRDALRDAGCERIFEDTASGVKAGRPALARLFDQLRAGDLLVVTELSRFGRSTRDLITQIERLRGLEVSFRSLAEPFIDTTTPQGTLIFTIFSAIAEFERQLIVQRTRDGLAAARARGKTGGRPPADPRAVETAIALHRSTDMPIKDILAQAGIGRSTMYKYLKESPIHKK